MEVEQPPPLIFQQHYASDQQKSKTTNVADLIHEINKQQKQNKLEQTVNFTHKNKASFFSQSKHTRLLSPIDNIDGTFMNDGSYEEDIEAEDIQPYDERA